MAHMKAGLLSGGSDMTDVIDMYVKMLLAWGVAVLCITLIAHSQSDVIDLRRTSSLGNGTTLEVLKPDPLGIDVLMRTPDIEHTWEYLETLRRWGYTTSPGVQTLRMDGNWHLSLSEGYTAELMLFHNRDAIFGKGVLTPVYRSAYATGQVVRSVVYLDLLTEDLVLYRCMLTIRGDILAGSYYAFSPQGMMWSGQASMARA